MQKAKDIMTREVLTVPQTMDIHTLARTLSTARISGAPVVGEHGELVGVVSLHDLVHHEGQVGDTETAAYWHSDPRLPRGYNLMDLSQSETTVEQIMTPAVYSVSENASLSEVCDYFLKGEIHRVLVTEGGKLRGIITPTDMIRCFQKHLAAV